MAGYIGSGASVVSSGVENKKVFDITTNTTSLTGLNYTVGKVHVYHNGVRLVDGTDYTANNSTSITLTVAAVSGDQVVVVSFASFQLSEHYTSAEADAEFVTKTGDTMSGNLDVTGTVTADGLTVEGNLVFPTETAYASANSIRKNSNALIFSGGTSGYYFNRYNNGATDLSIDSSGNVGLATDSPQSRLHILSDNSSILASNGAAIKGIQVSRSSGNSENLYMYTTSAAGWSGSTFIGRLETYGNNVLEIGSQQGAPISFGTSNTERMKIDASGRVTTPNQPSFFCTKTSGGTYSGSASLIDGWSVQHNQGGHFSNDRFTAPVSGVYHFDFLIEPASNYNSNHYLYLAKNGSQLSVARVARINLNYRQGMGGSMTIPLATNDYVEVRLTVTSGSTSVDNSGWFSGYLIG